MYLPHWYTSHPMRIQRIEHHFGAPAILRKWRAGGSHPQRAILWASDIAYEAHRNALRLTFVGDYAGAERLDRLASTAIGAAQAMRDNRARQAVAA